MSSTPLEPGLVVLNAAIRNSVAPSTWLDYCAAWSRWQSFNYSYGSSDVNPSEETILAFLCSLMQEDISPSKLNKIMSGLSFFFRLHSFPACSKFFSVRQALKGYKKARQQPDERRPITMELLSRIVFSTAQVCTSQFESILFSTVFVLAFFAALRISELVSPNRHSCSILRLQDIQLSAKSLSIKIQRSKTDPTGKGSWVMLNECGVGEICPVKWIQHYLKVRPMLNESFFIHEDGSPVTKYQFAAVLHKCVAYLGLGHLKFSSHSFRIGAATEAARLGLHTDVIKRLGRWESNRFKLYVRPNLCI
ncbi:integrase/recombinase xerD homolog [Mantella aurantiaca]